MFKVGETLKLNGNPWDEQISEELELYHELKDEIHIVTETKDTSRTKGTSGQWVKTDVIPDDWTDSAWFNKYELSDALKVLHKDLSENIIDVPPDIAKIIDESFKDLL